MDDQLSQDSENLTLETCLDETDTDNVRFSSNIKWVWPVQFLTWIGCSICHWTNDISVWVIQWDRYQEAKKMPFSLYFSLSSHFFRSVVELDTLGGFAKARDFSSTTLSSELTLELDTEPFYSQHSLRPRRSRTASELLSDRCCFIWHYCKISCHYERVNLMKTCLDQLEIIFWRKSS